MSSFPNLRHEDTRRLVVSSSAILLLAMGASFISPTVAVIAMIMGVFVAGSLFVMHYHREMTKHSINLAEHFQDLQFLQSQIDLRKPLPYLTGWSASPALASRLYSLIKESKPATILELGSGVSTVVMAYAIQKVGMGKLISIDHDKDYAEKTRAELKRHRLDHLVDVIHTPLVMTTTKGGPKPWYDISVLKSTTDINLLIIDGPPRHTCRDARLPAFEQLSKRLAPGCIVVIDDSLRPDEKRSLDAWTIDCDLKLSEDIPSEKGVSVRFLRLTHGLPSTES